MHTPPIRRVNPHLPFGDQKGAPYYGWDILSAKQFHRNDIQYILEVPHEMSGMVRRAGTFDLLKVNILTNQFYQHSTPTPSSFTSAMQRLG